MKKLSEECINFRALHGLTQKKFANVLGISLPTLIAIEKEHRTPSRYMDLRIRMYINGERPAGTIPLE